jgi:hypothetical protein
MPTSRLCFFEYFRARLSDLISKVAMDQLYFYTPFTEPVKIPCCCPNSFYTVVNLFGIKQSNFVSACTSDFDTPPLVTGILRDFSGNAPKRVQISYVCSERTRNGGSSVLFKMEPDI